MDIQFLPDARYVSNREVVEFGAKVNDDTRRCEISCEALADHFDEDFDAPLAAFENQRKEIEAVATRLILQGRYEPDGSILIRTVDC